ncbi:hypothetical protein PM082_021296 [Marasmius tenuissimus]|nr:hypothetical protein PM082_021296 [Marasmius tenuissimus]
MRPPFPKLIALDTDGMIFTGQLDRAVWGTDLDNIICVVNKLTIEDKNNRNTKIKMGSDIPRIVNNILNNSASLVIMSRGTSEALCNQALYFFHAKDPESGKRKPIIELVCYNEAVDEQKSNTFKQIHGQSNYDYTDMVLFDDKAPKDVSNLTVAELPPS